MTVDAVYLWVNGNDRRFKSQLRRYRPSSTPEPGRFRDNDELKFSLRSLEQHAPWIRNVHLVTSCSPPQWLLTEHPRLRIVPEEMLFEPGVLPTFNSNAIEWQLRKIPGLSERFLYLCDDFFLGRPVAPEDFLTTGQRVYLERWHINRRPHPEDVYSQSAAFTLRMLDSAFGRAERAFVTHSPRLYDRRILAEVERRWQPEIQATTRHRFRAHDDAVPDLLYHHYLLEAPSERGRHLAVSDADYSFVMLTPRWRAVIPQLTAIRQRQPKFFCLNDDLPAGPSFASWVIRRHARYLLNQLYPDPSSFERITRSFRRPRTSTWSEATT